MLHPAPNPTREPWRIAFARVPLGRRNRYNRDPQWLYASPRLVMHLVQKHASQGSPVPPTPTTDTHAWFEQVATENYRLFFSVAYRLVRNAHAAEDAVQTALVKGWRRLHDLDGRDGAVPWLCSIVRNTALDMLKKGGKTSTVNMGEHQAKFADYAAPTADEPQGDLMAVLWEEIDKLTESQAIVLTLRHGEGLELQEIADRLGIENNTVRVRVFRAYEKLRRNPRVRKALGIDDD